MEYLILSGTRNQQRQGPLADSLSTYRGPTSARYKGSNSENTIWGEVIPRVDQTSGGFETIAFMEGIMSLGRTAFTFSEGLLLGQAGHMNRAGPQ